MKRIALILAPALLVALAGVQVAPLSTQARTPRRGAKPPAKTKVHRRLGMAEPKSPEPVRRRFVRALGDGNPGVFSVVVDPDLTLDPDTQALYQQMANTLNGYAAVPNDRLNYYAAVNNQRPANGLGIREFLM